MRSAGARRLLGAFLHSAYDSLPFRGPPRDPSLGMSLSPYDPSNETEIAYWNGAGGRNWVHRQEGQDTILAPILRAAIERAAVRPGERVVDVGCGTGATSIELGGRVGLSGHVLGVDVSGPMLARAVERLPTDVPVEFVRADATTYQFEPAAFDLLFSRFGVMFFAEPSCAFTNLRTALRPGGRLAFACWRKSDENPWLMVPLRAAYEHVAPLPRPGPEDPGPFSFASEERVRRILGEAGFQSAGLEPRDLELDIACGNGIEEAVKTAVGIGPVSRAIEAQPPKICTAVTESVRRALLPYQRAQHVPLAAAIWLVTASNP
jgi:SAM-dependent methyltransferase